MVRNRRPLDCYQARFENCKKHPWWVVMFSEKIPLLLDEDNVFISLLDDIGNMKNNKDPKHTLID